jgi:hypothetical protein
MPGEDNLAQAELARRRLGEPDSVRHETRRSSHSARNATNTSSNPNSNHSKRTCRGSPVKALTARFFIPFTVGAVS